MYTRMFDKLYFQALGVTLVVGAGVYVGRRLLVPASSAPSTPQSAFGGGCSKKCLAGRRGGSTVFTGHSR